MRKLLPALLGAVIIAMPLHAQASLGVLGGFVSSSVTANTGTVSITPSSRSGFAIGLTATTRIAPKLSVGPDLMYIAKGFKSTFDGANTTSKFNYVEIPVLLHARFGQGPVQVVLLGGPALSIKVSCSVDASQPGGASVSESCETGGGNIKSTDFSLMFGGGLRFGQIAVTARYDLGLTNIDGNSTDESTLKNHALLILLGYHFRK